MNMKQTLTEVRKLIEKEENWCKSSASFFKDSNKKTLCNPKNNDPRIYSMGLTGAIRKVINPTGKANDYNQDVRDVMNFLIPFINLYKIPFNSYKHEAFCFNNNAKILHKDVLEMLDKAIEAA